MKECYLYKKLKNNTLQCQTCSHYCIIENNKRGICQVRENKKGKLYSLVYGKLCALNIDPIEKKPFFHFLPGTYSLSLASVGCNFSCASCQNWTISQGPKIFGKIEGENVSPQQVVKIALKNNLSSISYTYTEPTVFLEFCLDTMKIAKTKGLKNAWVSNGFFSKETFTLIKNELDAINIDFKSASDEFYKKYCQGKLSPVLENLKRIKKQNIWLEITTLVIPGLNDSEKEFKKIANFIKKELGPETPWHISRFCGAISWKLQQIPDTPLATLKKAYKIGIEAGLKYVYIGNVPGTELEDTFCPKCKTKNIERTGYEIIRYDKNGRCSKCGENLNIIL